MSDKLNYLDNLENAKDYLKVLLEVRDLSRDITSFSKELLQVSELNSEQGRTIISIHRQINREITAQSDNIRRVLDSEKKTKDITKDIVRSKELIKKAQKESFSISQKIQSIQNEIAEDEKVQNVDGYISRKAELDQVSKINDALKEQQKFLRENIESNEVALKISQQADKKSQGFTVLSNVVKSIPGLKAFSTPFEKAADAARKAALEGKSSLSAGLGSFMKGPIWITALLAVGAFFVKAMFTADKHVTNIAKNLLISKTEAADIYNNFKATKFTIDGIYNTTKDVNEAWSELVDLSNFTVNATKDQINAQILLTKNLGLSKEQALEIQEIFASSNIESIKGKDIIYKQISAFTNQNKLVITGKKAFEEIAKTSKIIQLNFRGNLDSLVKTTLESKKLGLSLDQINKIGKSLLDFESSISSQIEAELITGRKINLEKARLYALNHDIAGLTDEIIKQNITYNTFSNMNVIAQDAISKSLGLSSEELGDALYKQKVIQQTAGNFTKELREQAKTLKINNNLTGAIRLERRAEAIEKGLIEGKSLELAERSTTAQEKFSKSLERAQEIFSDLVDGGTLNKLSNIIKGIADSISKTASFYNKYVDPFMHPIHMDEVDKNYESQLKQSLNVNDFVIKTNPKDTIVAAGGTKLGNTDELLKTQQETNKLLAQLLHKNTDLYIDYNKFATAGSKTTYNLGS